VNDLDEKDAKIQSASVEAFFFQIKGSAESVRKDGLKAAESYLKSSDYNTRNCGVLIKSLDSIIKRMSNHLLKHQELM
jgi:hypothetical protein